MPKNTVSASQTEFQRGDGTLTPTSPSPLLPITYPTGAANGYVWTSDANGNGSWQTPAGGAPTGSAGGDLSGTYPNPSVAKIGSAATSGQYARGNGSAVVLSAIQAGDVPTLNQSTTGNAATATNLAGGAVVPAYLAPAVTALTFVGSGTTLVNAALGNSFNLTLTASTTTLGSPSNPEDGQVIRFRITQGSGGSFTLSYAGGYDFGAAGSPTLSITAAKVDVLGFEYVASISSWCYLGSALGN